MQFLYPISRQFPFDETCEQIVRELEKRNWQVPGIDVEFHEYGSGEQKFRAVSKIKSQDFKLWFCRVQRTMPGGRWNDTAAVTEIVIPKKELHVYEDESGPTLYIYAGKNYERDREKFMNGSKVNSKLNKEPKMYLQYKGGCQCRSNAGASFEAIGFLTATITGDTEKLARMNHTHPGRRPPMLVHDNDLGREYEPERGKWNWLKWCREPSEPSVFFTEPVMQEFKQYLEDIVLNMIVSHPIPTEKADAFAGPENIPFPESAGSLFCFCEYREAERIKQGKVNPEKLDLADRYGLTGSGYRLMSLGTANDGTVPEIAYDGFLWCGIGEVTAETEIESLEIPGHYQWSDRERFVIRINPNRANDIYIADHRQYEKRRDQICKVAKRERRDRLTDEEVADFTRARACTIIPISEYKGGYEQPVILINRELSFDEVEIAIEPNGNGQSF